MKTKKVVMYGCIKVSSPPKPKKKKEDEAKKRKRMEWLKASREGKDEIMATLLAGQPGLVTAVDSKRKTALHHAASHGHSKVVALLLDTNPAIIDATCMDGWTALHYAVSKGVVTTATQLLTAGPHLISAVTSHETTALHLAATSCSEKVVALILAACPAELIPRVDAFGRTALHELVHRDPAKTRQKGRGKVFEQLAAACPQLLDARDERGKTVLHLAILHEHYNLVPAILDVGSRLTVVVDEVGNTPLHLTIRGGGYKFSRQNEQFGSSDKDFITQLWRAGPEALHVANTDQQTPFDLAVMIQDNTLIELFQCSVSIDEIMSAFARVREGEEETYQYRPVIARQCKSLRNFLNKDVASIVFEYIGFDPGDHPPRRNKRTQLDTNEENRRNKVHKHRRTQHLLDKNT